MLAIANIREYSFRIFANIREYSTNIHEKVRFATVPGRVLQIKGKPFCMSYLTMFLMVYDAYARLTATWHVQGLRNVFG